MRSSGNRSPYLSSQISSKGRHMRPSMETKTSILSLKCQYTAPRVAPARCAISPREVRDTPFSKNTSSAASSSLVRVSSASALVLRAITHLPHHSPAIARREKNHFSTALRSVFNYTFMHVCIISLAPICRKPSRVSTRMSAPLRTALFSRFHNVNRKDVHAPDV